jgi:hypothetical protein
MFKKNTKTVLISLVIILLIVVGVYALKDQDNNKMELPDNENGVVSEVNNENEEDLQNRENIDVSPEEQGAVTTYLENNISELSPEEAVLGGAFYVTYVSFPGDNIAIVNYEDGHIALTAKANYDINSNNEVVINSFELMPDGSTVERNGSNDGDICINMCGDGVCQEMVCLGEGCPCAETAQSCPADCF